MSYVYICEQGAVVGVEGNRLQVKYKDGMVKTLPIEPLESIELFGRIQVSTACMTECLKRGITLGFFPLREPIMDDCLLPIMSMWRDKDYKLLCPRNSVWA